MVVTGMLVRFVRMSNDSAMCPRLRFGQQCVRVSLFSPCTVNGTVPPVSFYRYPVLNQNPLLPVNHGVVEVGRARDAHQPEIKQ